MTATNRNLSLALLALLSAPLAHAQQQGPTPDGEPLEVERVFVPEQGFDRVVKRYPRGVIVAELGARRAPAPRRSEAGPGGGLPRVARALRDPGHPRHGRRHGRRGRAGLRGRGGRPRGRPGGRAPPARGRRRPRRDRRRPAGPHDREWSRRRGPARAARRPLGRAGRDRPSATRTVAWTLALPTPGEERGAGVISIPSRRPASSRSTCPATSRPLAPPSLPRPAPRCSSSARFRCRAP